MGRWGKLLLLFLAAGLSGCSYGGTHNPVSFPNLPIFGDVVRTHSKPGGEAYFHDYDRVAQKIEVVLQAHTAPVQSRQIVLVSVLDAKGCPLSGRCVEWQLEGAGRILEVDESGLFPGRGEKVDSRYAVSYTDLFAHTLKKHTGHAEEDIPLKPGQTWCVLSSMTEGDSQLSIWVPGVANWDENLKVVSVRWVDANWELPRPQSAPRKSQPLLTTRVWRQTDHAPVMGYRVRYRILDGAPAVFVDKRGARGPEAEARTDERGTGTVAVAPTGGAGGRTRIGIDIIRPADPRLPSGPVVVIGQGETAIDWEAPALSLEQVAPASVSADQDMTISLMVTNKGSVPSGPVVVRAPVPEGLRYVSSEPLAVQQGNELVWQLADVPAREQRALRMILHAEPAARSGPVTSLVSLQSGDGATPLTRQDRSATIQILPPEVPRLVVEITGPKRALLGVSAGGPAVPGQAVPLQVVVRNLGTGISREGVIHAQLEGGLQYKGKQKLESPLEPLQPGGARTLPLAVTPIQSGPARLSVWIEGQTGPPVVHNVVIREQTLGLKILGERTGLVGAAITWELEVVNRGTAPATNVTVQDRLPPGVELVQASGNALRQNGMVSWELGTLMPGQPEKLQVTGRPTRLGENLRHEARVTGYPAGEELPGGKREAPLAVYASTEFTATGRPALKLQVRDNVDPVAVGGATTYRIDLTNQGSSPAKTVQVTAALPEQMKLVGVRGPTPYRQAGLSLTFTPIEQLMPGQTITYFVDVTAQVPGAARLRVELLGGPGRESLVQEESTTIR